MKSWWQWRRRQLLYDYILHMLPLHPITDKHIQFFHYFDSESLSITPHWIGIVGCYPKAIHFHWWSGWVPRELDIQRVWYDMIHDPYRVDDYPSIDLLHQDHHAFIVWLAHYYLLTGNNLPWRVDYLHETPMLFKEYIKTPLMWKQRMAYYHVSGSLLYAITSPQYQEETILW